MLFFSKITCICSSMIDFIDQHVRVLCSFLFALRCLLFIFFKCIIKKFDISKKIKKNLLDIFTFIKVFRDIKGTYTK